MSLVINTSPSLTDLSDRLNLMDARSVLNRAVDRNDTAALAAWALKWGEPALEATEAANDAERGLKELRDTVEDAVRKMERIMTSDDCSDALANKIGPIVDALAEAA